MNGGITFFSTWYDWASGAIDQNGIEIWNDGDLQTMISHIDEHDKYLARKITLLMMFQIEGYSLIVSTK